MNEFSETDLGALFVNSVVPANPAMLYKLDHHSQSRMGCYTINNEGEAGEHL